MNIVQCTHDRHAARILDVFNEAIVTSTALFDYQPRMLSSMVSWFKAKENGHFPVIGVEDDTGLGIQPKTKRLGRCGHRGLQSHRTTSSKFARKLQHSTPQRANGAAGKGQKHQRNQGAQDCSGRTQ